MWPVSTRVNKPENDDPGIVERLEFEESVAQAHGLPDGCYTS